MNPKLQRFSKWLTCTRCGLHKLRRYVVLGDGDIPADILFIGIGPGKSENLRGIPFCGPSGRILHDAIEDATKWLSWDKPPSIFFLNLVACRPTEDGIENRNPTDTEIEACWPRVVQTAALVKPKIVILLGDLVQQCCKRQFPQAVEMYHPAYLTRMGGVEGGLYRPYYRKLADVFASLRESPALVNVNERGLARRVKRRR